MENFNTQVKAHRKNILGELVAENDLGMLNDAFHESSTYRELLATRDFRFVVGRRGTGKSALFQRVAKQLATKGHLLLTSKPDEAETMAWHGELSSLTSDYGTTRAITRNAWKIQVLTEILDKLREDGMVSRKLRGSLTDYKATHLQIFKSVGLARSLVAVRIARRVADVGHVATQVPQILSDHFQSRELAALVQQGLEENDKRVIFLYDGLDEGWVPDQVATGILGGLTKLASEFNEASRIHCLLFIRDNMFRALAQLDGDYSRHIEGNALRLHWDERSLLNLVAMRIRAAFNIQVESDTKVWNRFAQRELEGLEGFRKCLKLTLYRPRDVIALLNGAFHIASDEKRSAIVESDILTTATRISQTRFQDLCVEYQKVLPGLSTFAASFKNGAAFWIYADVIGMLDAVVSAPATGLTARDFALLNTGVEAFRALYSVGFLGIRDAMGATQFCHDGSNTNFEQIETKQVVVIHPCYWRALGIEDPADEVLLKVNDEKETSTKTEGVRKSTDQIKELRTRKLGTIISELGKIPRGSEAADDFEKWVFSATSYLFAKGLDNISRRPNPGQLQRRDIVGTVNVEGGKFWRRIAKYDVKQLIIEAKNYDDVKQDEFRQCWGYLNAAYGQLMIMVTRSTRVELTEQERALVQEGYNQSPRKLVLLVSAEKLHHTLGKMRKAENRDDYTDSLLCKVLDSYEREHVGQKAPRAKLK